MEQEQQQEQKQDENHQVWNVGSQPVDLSGRPLTDKSKRGGWKAAAFIFGNEIAERMAYFGLAANFITYLVYKYHFTFPAGATVITNVLGTSCLTPLIGAFLADAYIGRYWTITIFSIIYLIGLIMLTLSALIPSLLPSSRNCTDINLYLGTCVPASPGQLAFLYIGLYVVALGSGGIRPCVSAFGADQFDEDDRNNLANFFNAFYFMITLGVVASLTIVVYVQDFVGWGWGLGLLAAAMLFATVVFVAGTKFYRHRIPSGSPLTRFAQVVTAAFRKRKLELPRDEALLHEVFNRQSAIPGCRKIKHTNHLRFFDKAAIETKNDKLLLAAGPPSAPPSKPAVSSWNICTVSQVEELKAMVRLIPIWITIIPLNTIFIQLLNFSVQQGLTMDRHLGKMLVPAASVPVFAALLIVVALPLYARFFVPAARRITGKPQGVTSLQRIGTGLILGALATAVAATVEKKRRNVAYATGSAYSPVAQLPYSALWLVPQYGLAGLAEVFASIGALEFFYAQAPDSVRSVGVSFFSTAAAAGSYFASALVTSVKRITSHGGRRQAWLANNINFGHLDRYYWLLAVLSVANFAVFVFVATRYEYNENSGDTGEDDLEQPKNKSCSRKNPLFESVCNNSDKSCGQEQQSDRSMELVKLVAPL